MARSISGLTPRSMLISAADWQRARRDGTPTATARLAHTMSAPVRLQRPLKQGA
jgi:hypothetical protein